MWSDFDRQAKEIEKLLKDSRKFSDKIKNGNMLPFFLSSSSLFVWYCLFAVDLVCLFVCLFCFTCFVSSFDLIIILFLTPCSWHVFC